MKKAFAFLFLITFFLAQNSCRREDMNPTPDPAPNPYGTGNGQFSFWIKSDLQTGNISIYVEGESVGTISHYHAGGITCGSGDVNFIKPAGSYNWNATAVNGATWSGTLNIGDGTCNKMELTLSGGGNPLPSSYYKQGTITVRSTNLEICVRDFSLVDGDKIDVVINGTTYLSNYQVTGTNYCFNVTLPSGNNWIGIIAKSEGSSPPCTPGISVNDGITKQVFEIQSKVGSTQGAYIINVVL
jgi:hypothetical protein